MTRTHAPRRIATVAAAAAVAATGLVTFSSGANAAVGLTGTATPSLGTVAAGTVVSVAGTGFTDAAGTVLVGSPKVVLGTNAVEGVCTGTGVTTWTSPVYSVVSATRIIVTLPAMPVVSPATSIKAAICFPITGSSPASYVTAKYTAAVQPLQHASAPIKPTSGPMAGGQTLSLYALAGTIWQPGAVVKIGGVPAANVTYSTDKTVLTATTPISQSSGNVPVVVSTPGFADVNVVGGYSYTRAITVTPNVGTTTVATPITIKGAGFTSSMYSTVTPAAAAHSPVLTSLTSSATITAPAGSFLATDVGATVTGVGTIKTVATGGASAVLTANASSAVSATATAVTPVAHSGALTVYLLDNQLGAFSDPVPTSANTCGAVQVISDTELTCVVPTSVGAPSALRVVVTDAAWASKLDSNDTVVSRGAIFTRADF